MNYSTEFKKRFENIFQLLWRQVGSYSWTKGQMSGRMVWQTDADDDNPPPALGFEGKNWNTNWCFFGKLSIQRVDDKVQ